jgi:hypothetical protein
MTRVVPSQVVAFIDHVLPEAKSKPDDHHRLGNERAGQLRTVVQLANGIPSELLQISGEDYTNFVAGVASLEHIVQLWLSLGNVDAPQKVMGRHPLVLIRQALTKCPDQSPAPSTTDLPFLRDAELQANIRNDIGAAHSGLHTGDWKGATVLAGSAAEALLLWGIQTLATTDERNEVIANLSPAKASSKPKSANPEDWTFDQYIEVSLALKIIEADTAIQARLAKDYRNLIHPGRALRLDQVCDRATALSAIAAVEHIVRNLKTRAAGLSRETPPIGVRVR